ncbi:uncharacterized protein F5Z01DRAFT_629133 [Emericellopsis atlantica]|uniref:Uncharacterized protein n=1 Tax=Emericellopsis atlantica TaxID=2614577 RepID=A0A9P7ZEI5_9HYPO|nr:uncharacterized protein F5Z01DRAFT_629133 [Emericellopsis atlantica]KAG9250525.1 hypothetical protein F5Z01DRAFT_629133 [Emericellopsis atlantica]
MLRWKQHEDARRSIADNLLRLLPQRKDRRLLIGTMRSMGYTRDDLHDICHTLEGETGDVSCERFLEMKGYRPPWLINIILSDMVTISDPELLDRMIDHCTSLIEVPGAQRVAPDRFLRIATGLAGHAVRLDGILLPKIADMIIAYLRRIDEWERRSNRAFAQQCKFYNSALEVFSTTLNRWLPPTYHIDPSFYWKAQSKLLEASAAFEKPLRFDYKGFCAVRKVLAAMPKNAGDIHNVLRHAHTWPPRLLPGDGIDEATRPEDNWSRPVTVSTLQQEAGFAMNDEDLAWDTIGGRAPDGSPTIKQEIVKGGPADTWTASIRATRNATEAWACFNHPPVPGQQPTPSVYAAMFAKLFSQDVRATSGLLPGERAYNFPPHSDTNLSEYERQLRQPPDAYTLYADMREADIRPRLGCLEILVRNARTEHRARQYLMDSGDSHNLALSEYGISKSTFTKTERRAWGRKLRKIPLSLVAAYVKCLTSLDKTPARQLKRAIIITSARMRNVSGHDRLWGWYMWGAILRASSNRLPRSPLGEWEGTTLAAQLKGYRTIVSNIEKMSHLRLPTLRQYCKCLRKSMNRAFAVHMDEMHVDVGGGELQTLRLVYDDDLRESAAHTNPPEAKKDQSDAWVPELRTCAEMLKSMVRTLRSREEKNQKLQEKPDFYTLEHMVARVDPVGAGSAYTIMSALAFTGEFVEMSKYLAWLMTQWKQAGLREDLLKYDEVPAVADFHRVLCVFRCYAEPMLPPDVVEQIRTQVQQDDLIWRWPDEEEVELFPERQGDLGYVGLAHTLKWVRYWRLRQERGEKTFFIQVPPNYRRVIRDIEERRKVYAELARRAEEPGKFWSEI